RRQQGFTQTNQFSHRPMAIIERRIPTGENMSILHKLMRARARLAAALLTCAALTLCTGAPLRAQELRLGMGADVTSIDPHFVNLFPNNNVALHIFDCLVM